MLLRKIVRVLLITLSCCAGLSIIFLIVTVAPLDRTVDRSPLTEQMSSSINTLAPPEQTSQGFSIGFSKVNLTPPYKTATAGYGKRMGKLFTTVHDSIFVRTLVIDNGVERVAIVSADLLLIPPEVTALLEKELPAVGLSLDKTYLSATHSHNSIGNWGKGVLGILYGKYDDSIVRHIASRITQSVEAAGASLLPATIKTGSIPVTRAVRNRLADNNPVDSMLRVIAVTRSDSSRLLLMNFTAHATCLFSRNLELSRDYPGKLIDIVETHGYDFAMFLAGAVGSHSGRVREQGWPCVDDLAMMISSTFASKQSELQKVDDETLWMKRVPLLLTDPQVKVLKNWRIRPWLFNAAFGDYPEYLTALRIGDLIMIGTPCDFSGEFYPGLDSLASKHGMKTMITSFNGSYIGYVTPSRYYDRDHYETQLMNWYGQGNAEYMKRCIEELMLRASPEN